MSSFVSSRQAAPTSHQYRELKQLDMDSFQQRLKNSSLFALSSTTADEYLDEMEHIIGDTLDDLAPLRIATRPGEKGSARWLSPEAVEAKRFRRRLERQWKRTEKESNRRAYQAACWRANKSPTKPFELSPHAHEWPVHIWCNKS